MKLPKNSQKILKIDFDEVNLKNIIDGPSPSLRAITENKLRILTIFLSRYLAPSRKNWLTKNCEKNRVYVEIMRLSDRKIPSRHENWFSKFSFSKSNC